MIETPQTRLNKLVTSEQLTQDPLENYLPATYRVEKLRKKVEYNPNFFTYETAKKYAEYLRLIAHTGKAILQQVMGDFFEETGCTCTFEPKLADIARGEGAARQSAYDEEDEDGIVFRFRKAPTPGSEWKDQVSAFSRTPELVLTRGIRDLLTYIHEYTHELFLDHFTKGQDRRINSALKEKYYDLSKKYPPDLNMVERCINEGIAILTEILAVEELKRNFATYGLEATVLSQLDFFLEARKKTFVLNEQYANSSEKSVAEAGWRALAYNEGFSIISILYQKFGLAVLLKKLATLDQVKLAITERTSNEYEAVKVDPEKLFILFGEGN